MNRGLFSYLYGSAGTGNSLLGQLTQVVFPAALPAGEYIEIVLDPGVARKEGLSAILKLIAVPDSNSLDRSILPPHPGQIFFRNQYLGFPPRRETSPEFSVSAVSAAKAAGHSPGFIQWFR